MFLFPMRLLYAKLFTSKLTPSFWLFVVGTTQAVVLPDVVQHKVEVLQSRDLASCPPKTLVVQPGPELSSFRKTTGKSFFWEVDWFCFAWLLCWEIFQVAGSSVPKSWFCDFEAKRYKSISWGHERALYLQQERDSRSGSGVTTVTLWDCASLHVDQTDTGPSPTRQLKSPEQLCLEMLKKDREETQRFDDELFQHCMAIDAEKQGMKIVEQCGHQTQRIFLYGLITIS